MILKLPQSTEFQTVFARVARNTTAGPQTPKWDMASGALPNAKGTLVTYPYPGTKTELDLRRKLGKPMTFSFMVV